MLVATWNINGLRARLDFLLHWLRSRRPDVVGLQELKLEEHEFPWLEFEAEGYHAVVHGQKAWNGVAVLSRSEPVLVSRGFEDDAGESRLVASKVGDLLFSTVYCPNGKSLSHPDFQWKLRWFDALDRWLRKEFDPREPVILCGDFNICPEPIDSWNEAELSGSIFHTEAERERMRRLRDWGLQDLYRHLHPNEVSFSWWDYRAGAFHRNMGLRIDLMLGTAPVAARLRRAEIDREYRKKKEGLTASDHAPVLAEVDF